MSFLSLLQFILRSYMCNLMVKMFFTISPLHSLIYLFLSQVPFSVVLDFTLFFIHSLLHSFYKLSLNWFLPFWFFYLLHIWWKLLFSLPWSDYFLFYNLSPDYLVFLTFFKNFFCNSFVVAVDNAMADHHCFILLIFFCWS